MPPIPTQCQSLATQVTALETSAATLRSDAQASVGQPAWTKLGQLGLVLQELERKQAELATCIAAHSGDVVYEIVFLDGGGGPVTGDREAHLWDMGASPPTRVSSVPVQDGSFAFPGPPPAGNIALAVEASASTAGPDFRSGPMPVPAAGTSQRIEIVAGPTVTITPDDLTRWLGNVSFQARRIDTGVGTLEVTLTSLAAALAPDTITLTGVGTVSLVAATGGSQVSPFSASVTVGFVASSTPAAVVPLEPKKIGNPTVHVGGPLAILGAMLNLGLGFGLWDVVLNQVRDIARDEVLKETATAISLANLPANTTVSLRSVTVDATGIRFQPMLGALGTALSTYQPAAADIL